MRTLLTPSSLSLPQAQWMLPSDPTGYKWGKKAERSAEEAGAMAAERNTAGTSSSLVCRANPIKT